MRKYLIVLLFLTTVYGQTILNANCGVQADKYGFVELQAYAGYFIGSDFYCYNTNVSVTITGNTYDMEQLYTCDYFKLLQLPSGSYDVLYTAKYPDHDSQQAQCHLDVTSQGTMDLVVYGLKNGDTFRPGSTLAIQTVAVVSNYNVNADIAAKLLQGTTVLRNITLASDTFGAESGSTVLNLSEGGYIVRINAAYQNFSVQRDYAITISSSQVQNASIAGINLVVLEPENIVYPEKTKLSLQVELQDQNNAVVTGASVRADIYKDGDRLDTVQLQPTMWYYQGSYFFEDTGRYRIVYTATKGTSSANSNVSFVLGNETEISKTVNFTVTIVNPVSSVYIRDSIINARVKLTEDTEPVANASVILIFEGDQIKMSYDRFGEYAAKIGPLDEGAYDLKAVATKDNLVAQDKVTFMISKHVLNIDTISPYYNQEFELKKGDSLKVKAIVLDENRDIVSGALVVAKVLEPDGKALEMQLFQDTKTGDYAGTLYLNEMSGTYQLTIEASKPGYVPVSKNSQFDVTFKKEQIQIFSYYLTTENLLTIVLAIAIIILIAALLRAVF
jgi:hypothetical protein